jgi:hypothetical protein
MIVTCDWGQDPEHILGKLEIAPTPSAELAWKLLKENPHLYSFEIGYIVKEEKDGVITKAELVEISLVTKGKQ